MGCNKKKNIVGKDECEQGIKYFEADSLWATKRLKWNDILFDASKWDVMFIIWVAIFDTSAWWRRDCNEMLFIEIDAIRSRFWISSASTLL